MKKAFHQMAREIALLADKISAVSNDILPFQEEVVASYHQLQMLPLYGQA